MQRERTEPNRPPMPPESVLSSQQACVYPESQEARSICAQASDPQRAKAKQLNLHTSKPRPCSRSHAQARRQAAPGLNPMT